MCVCMCVCVDRKIKQMSLTDRIFHKIPNNYTLSAFISLKVCLNEIQRKKYILYHTKNLVLNRQISTREVKEFVLNGLFWDIVQTQLEGFIIHCWHSRYCTFLAVCLQNTTKYQDIQKQANKKNRRNTTKKSVTLSKVTCKNYN